jgi:hypothetical protein
MRQADRQHPGGDETFERLLGGVGERPGARAPKLRHNPAPVRDQHNLSGGHLAEIGDEPVFQLPHGFTATR